MTKPKIQARYLGIITAIHEYQPEKTILICLKDQTVTTMLNGITDVDSIIEMVGSSLRSIYGSIPENHKANFTISKFLKRLNDSVLDEELRSMIDATSNQTKL